MSLEQDTYRHLCEEYQASIPLMSQAWWLDAVSLGKKWDAVLLRDRSGDIYAALPFHLTSRLGISAALLPQLTQTISPWFRHGIDSSTALRGLIDRLKSYSFSHLTVRFQLAAYFDEAQRSELSAASFALKTRHSYVISPPSKSPSELPSWILSNMCESKRRSVRHAQASLTVSPVFDPSAFYDFIVSNLSSRGRSPLYGRELFCSLASAAISRGAGRLSVAVSPSGDWRAGLFSVSDASRTYYLVPTYPASSMRSGAMELLTFDSILSALSANRCFDFEGSDEPSIAEAYRRYGGSPVTYSSAEWFLAGSLGCRVFS